METVIKKEEGKINKLKEIKGNDYDYVQTGITEFNELPKIDSTLNYKVKAARNKLDKKLFEHHSALLESAQKKYVTSQQETIKKAQVVDLKGYESIKNEFDKYKKILKILSTKPSPNSVTGVNKFTVPKLTSTFNQDYKKLQDQLLRKNIELSIPLLSPKVTKWYTEQVKWIEKSKAKNPEERDYDAIIEKMDEGYSGLLQTELNSAIKEAETTANKVDPLLALKVKPHESIYTTREEKIKVYEDDIWEKLTTLRSETPITASKKFMASQGAGGSVPSPTSPTMSNPPTQGAGAGADSVTEESSNTDDGGGISLPDSSPPNKGFTTTTYIVILGISSVIGYAVYHTVNSQEEQHKNSPQKKKLLRYKKNKHKKGSPPATKPR